MFLGGGSQLRSELWIEMSQRDDRVLKGSPLGEIPDCSLGEYLVRKMRALPQDAIIQVDAEDGAVLTVGELMSAAVRVSEGLKKLGLRQDDVVGLTCRNSFEACQVVLGTWLSGAAVAAVPGTLTVGEFEHILGITRPKFMFCEEDAVSNIKAALKLQSLSTVVILVGDPKNSDGTQMTFREVLTDVDVENYEPQPVNCPSSQLAAILSSSGTSGLPKGVGITHRNLIFQSLTLGSIENMDPSEDYLAVSQFFWITGVLMFLWSLCSGMRLVLLRNPTVKSILKATDRYKPGCTLVAPLYALSIATDPDFEKYDTSSMKAVFVGGSPFTQSIGERLRALWRGVHFTQLYGATEVSGMLCCNGEEDNYSLGKATPGTMLKVVDVTTGEPLGPNATGEIWARTPGLMKCYVRNEEATRSATSEDGWYHTGDLGYYDDCGRVYFVDRLKEMVKISNMQVAPSELENAILSVPGVVETCVTGVTKDGLVFELLAAVVKDKNSTVKEEDIHSQITSNFSQYKRLTGGVYFVDSLPKTVTGKISRRNFKTMAQALYSKR